MQKETLVLESIRLNEQAIRAIDTKAQIFIAAILFSINSFSAMYTIIGRPRVESTSYVFLWVIAVCLSILSLVWVVSPAPFGRKGRSAKFMFVNSVRSLEETSSVLDKASVLEELCRELNDVEQIRIIKSNRMSAAIIITILSAIGCAIQVAFSLAS